MAATGSVPRTLVGFAPDLDWRPVHFVRPIPRIRVCSACGLVRTRTVLLPCPHVLCESCYDQCTQDGERVCPLDGLQCLQEDVEWKEWSADELLNRQVKCWNEGSGCAVVMAASEITRHFQRECDYHSVPCPKCSVMVLQSDVCAHLRSDCRPLVSTLASEYEEQSHFVDEKAIFSSFRRALQEQAREMRVYLEWLSAERGNRDDRLNEIFHSMNAFKEVLRQELIALKESTRVELTRFTETLRDGLAEGRMREETSLLNESLRQLPEVMKRSEESFTTNVSEIVACNKEMKECLIGIKDHTENIGKTMSSVRDALKNKLAVLTKQNAEKLTQIADTVGSSTAETKKMSEKTLHWIKDLLSITALHGDHCVFVVKGVKAIKEAALKEGFRNHFHENVYLRGYRISPGVKFKKDGDSVSLHVILQLQKGHMDESLSWPFVFQIKLIVANPANDKKCEMVVRPGSSQSFQRPTESSNMVAVFVEPAFHLDDLARDRYIYNDELRMMWQLLL